MPKPLSADDLQSFVTQVSQESGFTERNAEYQYRLDLLHRRRKVRLPSGEVVDAAQWRDPILRNAANKYKNRMLSAPEKINVAARSQKERAVERAQRMEAFFYRIFRRWRARGTFDGALFNQAALGVGTLYLTLNRDLLPEFPEFKKGMDAQEYLKLCEPALKAFMEDEHDLFVLEDILPHTEYWTPGRQYVCSRANVPYVDLAKLYARQGIGINKTDDAIEIATISPGQPVDFSRKDWSSTVEFITAADDDYIYHLIAGEEGKTKVLGTYPNFFGVPPFFQIRGEVTGDPSPKDASLPLIDGLYATVPYKNLGGTAVLKAGLDTSEQRYSLEKIDQNQPSSEDSALEIRVLEGGILMPPDGYRITNPGIATGPDLNNALAFIQSEQSKYDYPRELGAPSEVTASSGYERAQQQDTVASLMNPPLEHWASMLANELFPAVAVGVETLGVPVTFKNVRTSSTYGQPQLTADSVTINPSDIMDAEISVKFSSLTIFNRIALQEEGMKLLEQKLMNRHEFITEVRDVDDYDAFQEQLERDQIRMFSSERAITDVQQSIDQLRSSIQQQAMSEANVNPLVVNSDLSRPDRGPSVPSGPGDAMPIAPTPAGMGDMAPPGAMPGAAPVGAGMMQ